MSTELDKDNLIAIRKELTSTINKLTSTIDEIKKKVHKAWETEKINDSKWQQAKDQWDELETQENELQGLIHGLELEFILNTNVESSRSRILDATNRLEDAATNIEEIDSFLLNIKDVIAIVASTIKAIKPG